jgi:hypothetical protein
MEFIGQFLTSFTIPTGAGPGTSRIVLTSDGKLISYDNVDVPNTFAALFNGKFFFGPQTAGHAADFTNAGSIGYSIDGSLAIAIFTSPLSPFGAFPAQLLLVSGDNTPLGAPSVSLAALSAATAINGNITGAWRMARTEVGGFAEYGWFTAPVIAANWDVNVAANPLRYRHRAEDDVEWTGEVVYTGANVAAAGGTILTDFPIDTTYNPTMNYTVPVAHLTTGRVVKNTNATAIIRTDGRFSIIWSDAAGTAHDANGLATGDIFCVNARVPLDVYIQP